MAKTPVTIRHDRDGHRVEAVLEDGTVAGFSAYEPRGGETYAFTHTEVGEEFEGQGIGSQVAEGVMQVVRDEGVRIEPQCSFIRSYMQRHDDTHDLLVPGSHLGEAESA